MATTVQDSLDMFECLSKFFRGYVTDKPGEDSYALVYLSGLRMVMDHPEWAVAAMRLLDTPSGAYTANVRALNDALLAQCSITTESRDRA